MKTTIELPDALFAAAKAVAVQRRTTLKAMMEHALRREIAFDDDDPPSPEAVVQRNARGFPVLGLRGTGTVTSQAVHRIMDEEGL